MSARFLSLRLVVLFISATKHLWQRKFAFSLEVLHLTAVVERCATFCAPIIGGRAGRARDSQRASANLIENNCRSLA